MDGSNQALQILADGQIDNVNQFRNIVVALRNGAPVRIGELAEVIDSVQDLRVATGQWQPRHRARRAETTGTNTVEWRAACAPLRLSQKQLPESIRLGILRDQSVAVHEAFADVQFTLMLAVGSWCS